MPVNIVVPAPAWVKVPVPLMAFANVRVLLRLILNAALLAIALEAEILPVVLPDPNSKIPPVMVVVPVHELVPVKRIKPVPVLVIPVVVYVPQVPDIALLKFADTNKSTSAEPLATLKLIDELLVVPIQPVPVIVDV